MLTADLLRVRVKGREVLPTFVDPDNERLLERAELLVDLVAQAVRESWTLGELRESERELEGVETDHKLFRGLFKVLMDRAEVDTVAALEPSQARALVFSHAAARGPLARRPGTGLPVAAELLAEVAQAQGLEVEDLRRALYADLKDEQRLSSWKALDAPGLLHRYNVGLVQAVLLRASWLRIRLRAPDPRRLAQLLRLARFHELMYRLEREGETVTVHLDGPESLLRQSTRYGLNLGRFFPAVLLHGSWRLEAELMWGKARALRKGLNLGPEAGLRSHFRDTGVWKSRTEQFFEDRWGEEQQGWRIAPGEFVVAGGQKVVCPAWTFRKEGRVAHLDVVGHWRKQSLEERLASTPPGVLLAVSKRLCGDKAGVQPGPEVVVFSEIIPVPRVVEGLDRVALRAPG